MGITTQYASDLVWILSTDFGRMVFTMIFLTWGLVIVDLFLVLLVLVRRILGDLAADSKSKKG